MNDYKNIEKKVLQFIRKYYLSQLIKGIILLVSFGFLFLFFLLFLEHTFWFSSAFRYFILIAIIGIKFFFLYRFICTPIFKLFGFQKGLSFEGSAKIIGKHFPDIDDKLLNIIQLKNKSIHSDLILASIDQKASELQLFSFSKAISFKKNIKYLRYGIPVFLVFLAIIITNSFSFFTSSFNRISNPDQTFHKPAPFSFLIKNDSLSAIQGTDFVLNISTQGTVVPEDVKVVFNQQEYFLNQDFYNQFSYTFSTIEKTIYFYVISGDVVSKTHLLEVVKTPTIQKITATFTYPKYLNLANKTVTDLGEISVPERTVIKWNVTTNQTDSLSFVSNKEKQNFEISTKNVFSFSKKVVTSFSYVIASSNSKLSNFDVLNFSVDVIKDDFPTIKVTSSLDSVSRGTPIFFGKLSDDYGISKLNFVYYDVDDLDNKKRINIEVDKANIQTFFYALADSLFLKNATNYECYFEVFDNDEVNGFKYSKSKVFSFRNKSNIEKEAEVLQDQKKTIDDLENTLEKHLKEQNKFTEMQEDIQRKKNLDWNDAKKIKKFLKRQSDYKKMRVRQTDELHKSLDKKTANTPELKDQKKALQDRINELKKESKRDKLLKEIENLAEKLDKNELLKKSKELAQQNKQQERSLERTLELVKRFYVEQKTMQITQKLDSLSSKQNRSDDLKKDELQEQKKLTKEFQDVKKDFEELQKDNQKLKDPMELSDVSEEIEEVETEQQKAEEELQNQQLSKSKKHQKKASKKLQQMSKKLQKSMLETQGESLDENIDDLRKVLENLISFSFKQESVFITFSNTSVTHPNFGKNLKKQNDLKTYFEHIDDSLYVLSMRVPKLSTRIQDDLSQAHFNLNQSLENFSESLFPQGLSNQQYVMTATNSLADYLSTILDNMQNSKSMKMGKRKGKGKGFSLPDLIKKQEGLSKKMQKSLGKKEGKKEGKEGEKGQKKGGDNEGGKESSENGKEQGNGSFNEDFNGELFQIYKEQAELRQQLQDALNNELGENPSDGAATKKVLKSMEDLENEILEKGLNSETLRKMELLNYELLKLQKAILKQGKDTQRKSTSNTLSLEQRKIKELELKKQFYNQTEILNRQSLPLQKKYKKKVQKYFSEPSKN